MSSDALQPDRRYHNNEETFRQLLEGQAAMLARMEEFSRGLGEAKTDAREARDQSSRLATTIEAQNMAGRVQELRSEIVSKIDKLSLDNDTKVNALRQDMVKNITDLKKDQNAHGLRLEALETTKTKAVGVADFFAWLAKVAPWIGAALAAYFAGLKAHGG